MLICVLAKSNRFDICGAEKEWYVFIVDIGV